jgi:cytochrome o ubiquinol oxidase operon protein cyoD
MKPKREHGTTRSYVVGFLLSLVLTLVAYSLVVGHVMSGNALVAAILGFAVLQMIVQIVFFLHLGREPKPHWNLAFFVATVGLIFVVVGGSMVIMHNLHYNMAPMDESKSIINDEGISQIEGEKTGACQELGTNHKVTIKDGQIIPAQTVAHECDTLTFINEDDATRDIGFGVSPDHGSYAGVAELSADKGRGKTITLSEPGTYQFYDRLHDKTQGSFTVTPQ